MHSTKVSTAATGNNHLSTVLLLLPPPVRAEIKCIYIQIVNKMIRFYIYSWSKTSIFTHSTSKTSKFTHNTSKK